MATVVCELSMSLDGFVADARDGVDEVFEWYEAGDVAVDTPGSDMTFHLTAESAAHVRHAIGAVRAFVTGRRTFDLTDGWSGRHPFDVPVFVVTHAVPDAWVAAHPDAPFTFVTDGVESAVAQAKSAAGDGAVAIFGPAVARQCLDIGLLDELWVDLAPVLLGDGVRLFGALAGGPVRLSDPEVVEGRRVTHLRYRVER
jgi:dihydrofolate reductase